jgi:hypothetical protein
MQTFIPRLDCLPPAQQALWPVLAPTISVGLTLYGGTAIALRLGHRSSVDFDFFSEQPLQKELLTQQLPFLATAETLQDAVNTWTVLVHVRSDAGDTEVGTVKVSFFGGINFGRIGEPEHTNDQIVTVASFDDLLANKLKVLLQRVEAKDYSDVAALLQAGISLDHGLGGAQTLFGPSFQPAECLRALVYFSGGDLATLSDGDRATLVAAVNATDLHAEIPIVPRLSESLGA